MVEVNGNPWDNRVSVRSILKVCTYMDANWDLESPFVYKYYDGLTWREWKNPKTRDHWRKLLNL